MPGCLSLELLLIYAGSDAADAPSAQDEEKEE